MELLDATLWAVGMALIGAIVFGLLGLVSGTDETATIAPVTLPSTSSWTATPTELAPVISSSRTVA